LPEVSWDDILALLPVAASCFVMIIAQSAATSRVYAVRHRECVDEDSDILGLAAANAAAAVRGTFVVNGSPTQTAMADSAGASRFFGVYQQKPADIVMRFDERCGYILADLIRQSALDVTRRRRV
jgi:MFS superfamily sulfate permease-like transporter